MFFHSTIKKLIRSDCHVDIVRFSLCSFLIYKQVDNNILWLCFDENIHDLKQHRSGKRRCDICRENDILKQVALVLGRK